MGGHWAYLRMFVTETGREENQMMGAYSSRHASRAVILLQRITFTLGF